MRLSFSPRPINIEPAPGDLIDLASPHVFLKAHTFEPHAGHFFKRQEVSFSDLLWGIDGQLKQEQWPALMDYPYQEI